MRVARVFLRNVIRINGDMLREVSASERLLLEECPDHSINIVFGNDLVRIPEPAIDAVYYLPDPPALPADEPPTQPAAAKKGKK